MFVMIAGLIIFLSVHSTRIFAEDWRNRTIDRFGERRWKGLYAFNALIGLALMVWGYGLARELPVLIWEPPLWGRHLTILLMAVAFVLVAQNGSPQGPVSARVGHPMTAGVAVWAIAHLLANGTLADILLFGSILIWSIWAFAAAKRRDRRAGTTRESAGWVADIGPGIGGLVVWLVFLWKAHQWLFGVSPLA